LRVVTLSSFVLLAVVLTACGDGGDDRSASGASSIPTATLPAETPEAIILGSPATPAGGQQGGEETYEVQSGDSPSSIASQFGITVEALMEANGISDPTGLFVGQVLTIPGASDGGSEVLPATEEPEPTPQPVEQTPEDTGEQVHVVQEGDIPETIAAQYGITAEELMAANGIVDPTGLYIGQELIIPAAE
jgi:LysM repeat protein